LVHDYQVVAKQVLLEDALVHGYQAVEKYVLLEDALVHGYQVVAKQVSQVVVQVDVEGSCPSKTEVLCSLVEAVDAFLLEGHYLKQKNQLVIL